MEASEEDKIPPFKEDHVQNVLEEDTVVTELEEGEDEFVSPSSEPATSPVRGDLSGVPLTSTYMADYRLNRRNSSLTIDPSNGILCRRKGFGDDMKNVAESTEFQSDIGKYLHSLSSHISAETRYYLHIPTVKYRQINAMTPSFYERQDWQNFIAEKNDAEKVSEVSKIKFDYRTLDQKFLLVNWLLTNWPTAAAMGRMKVLNMTKVLKYFSYEANENIITEGERGLTFYIIISGVTLVHKDGVGVVAKLGTGKSFGEIALSGKDLRTATVKTETEVEVLKLHKLEYDRFVKDIQFNERREQFGFYKNLSILSSLTRERLEKLANSSFRKAFEPGQYIFKQGDVADFFYFVFDGIVKVNKEIDVVHRNKWPVGLEEHAIKSKKSTHIHTLYEVTKGQTFGEHCVLGIDDRPTSAVAHTKCVVLYIDKKEMAHFLHTCESFQTKSILNESHIHWDDKVLLHELGFVNGGPSSSARCGDIEIKPNETVRVRQEKSLADKISSMTFTERAALLVPPSSHKGKHKQTFTKKNKIDTEVDKSPYAVVGNVPAMDLNIINSFMLIHTQAVKADDKDKDLKITTIMDKEGYHEKVGLKPLMSDILKKDGDYDGVQEAKIDILTRVATTDNEITTKEENYQSHHQQQHYGGRQRPSTAPNYRHAPLSHKGDEDIVNNLRSETRTLDRLEKRREGASARFVSITYANGQTMPDIALGKPSGVHTSDKEAKLLHSGKVQHNLLFSPVKRNLKNKPKMKFPEVDEFGQKNFRPLSAVVTSMTSTEPTGRRARTACLLSVGDLKPPKVVESFDAGNLRKSHKVKSFVKDKKRPSTGSKLSRDKRLSSSETPRILRMTETSSSNEIMDVLVRRRSRPPTEYST